VPEDRRVLYALEFLTGMRMGEAAAIAWRAYDATLAPLGRLVVATSYNTRSDKVKSTKTERPREVPVHATLAAVLAAWKLSGWRRMMGRPAVADDRIVPARGGVHEDLELLGLRKRRHCATRRTFVSLAYADGARKDVLRWVTHGPTGDIVDLYATLPWSTLCEAVACLRIGMKEAKVLQLRPAAAEDGRGVGDILETAAPAQEADEEKARRSRPSGP
jgi:integrase